MTTSAAARMNITGVSQFGRPDVRGGARGREPRRASRCAFCPGGSRRRPVGGGPRSLLQRKFPRGNEDRSSLTFSRAQPGLRASCRLEGNICFLTFSASRRHPAPPASEPARGRGPLPQCTAARPPAPPPPCARTSPGAGLHGSLGRQRSRTCRPPPPGRRPRPRQQQVPTARDESINTLGGPFLPRHVH